MINRFVDLFFTEAKLAPNLLTHANRLDFNLPFNFSPAGGAPFFFLPSVL